MKSYPLLLLALLATAHCASSPRWRADSGDAAPTSREEFDPRTLGEDGLLIEPVQREQEESDQTPTPAEPAAPAQEGAPVASAAAYRLQLMALSNEAAARRLRAELERALGVQVYLVARNEHSVLQAGQYATSAEAAALKEQVAALGPDYADAYVVEVSASAVSAEVAPEPVSAFGWKVQIALFPAHHHDKAKLLVEEAKKRLKREDIDMIFKEPYYKIEVGNYRTEAQAQAAAERIGRYYPLALKVRSQILVPQED